mmetsp:Transcript_13147/g.52468  ORF Transcript_13147/g.52468 Transcript_13147/m.52468 type:complete len:330 (-) Transcript_13147:87-1076(-)
MVCRLEVDAVVGDAQRPICSLSEGQLHVDEAHARVAAHDLLSVEERRSGGEVDVLGVLLHHAEGLGGGLLPEICVAVLLEEVARLLDALWRLLRVVEGEVDHLEVDVLQPVHAGPLHAHRELPLQLKPPTDAELTLLVHRPHLVRRNDHDQPPAVAHVLGGVLDAEAELQLYQRRRNRRLVAALEHLDDWVRVVAQVGGEEGGEDLGQEEVLVVGLLVEGELHLGRLLGPFEGEREAEEDAAHVHKELENDRHCAMGVLALLQVVDVVLVVGHREAVLVGNHHKLRQPREVLSDGELREGPAPYVADLVLGLVRDRHCVARLLSLYAFC